MASSKILTDKLILALNTAKQTLKSDESKIVENFMKSLNNKETFSDDSTLKEIKAAVESRKQDRENEDKVILGVKPEEQPEEQPEEPADEITEKTKEEEDIMSKFKWVLISIGIFIFLIIVGSIFYWYFSSQPEETIMRPRSNIQHVSTASPPQNVEVKPAQNYSYLPFMSAANVPDVNKLNELEKQEQERKRMEQETELKRIREQEEKSLEEEEKRLQEEKSLEEEKRLEEEKSLEEEKRLEEEKQRIIDDKEEQEELIKQSLNDDDKNNSSYKMSSTANTNKSSLLSKSSKDEKLNKGGKTKKQFEQVAKRKYVRKTK